MLTHIFIKNFAIIKEIDIDINEGLNIISGETGTGKSIVIQALSTALGGRGSASAVADGQEKALVQLVFSLTDEERHSITRMPEYSQFVTGENGSGTELIISREISRSGKSLARINGEIVTLTHLSGLTRRLVNIHGQYDNQTFLDQEKHLDILDSCGGKELLSLKSEFSSLYSNYQSLRGRLLKQRSNRAEALRKQDFMRFEVNEIDTAALRAGEDAELNDRLKVLQNGEKIYASLSESYETLSTSGLERCSAGLSEIAGLSDIYASLSSSFNDIVYALGDLCEEIRRARDSFTFEPGEIDAVISRLNQIDTMKRKYGGTIGDILAYRDKCAAGLQEFETSEDKEKEMTQQLSAMHRELLKMAEKLSTLRRAAGSRLAANMTNELSELNFANAQFSVDISTNLNSSGQPALSATGSDRVEFLFNANKGGSLKPMSEVASGGEISRIALAFKRLTGSAENVPVLIFDEIDTGISGITASVVGRKLHEIALKHQVLCITHLPQIAACGDNQYLISKDDADGRSYTTIKLLFDEERIEEIARLLGGANITDTTRASARELLRYSHS